MELNFELFNIFNICELRQPGADGVRGRPAADRFPHPDGVARREWPAARGAVQRATRFLTWQVAGGPVIRSAGLALR